MMPARERGLHVSVSQIKTYLRCPRQYELRYVRGEPREYVPVALVLGTAVHAALASYYTELRVGRKQNVDELLDSFVAAWRLAQPSDAPLVVPDDEPVPVVEQLGVRMLRAFHAQAVRQTNVAPVLVEAPFEVELNDPATGEPLDERLVGTIDLVADVDGVRTVFEHKTAARRFGQDQLEFDLQPTAYMLAARRLGLAVERFVFQVVTKAKTPAVQIEEVQRCRRDENDLLFTVAGVLRAVDAGVFFPVRGWQCRGCPYPQACARSAMSTRVRLRP